MSRAPVTRMIAYEAVAKSLRDFGYPDVTAKIIAEIHAAMERGDALPHGIIGAFAESQLSADEAQEFFKRVKS